MTDGILRAVYRRWPRLQPVMREVNGLVTRRPLPTFSGWMMTTYHQVPWIDGPPEFHKAAEDVRGFEGSARNLATEVDAWMWRHWNVAYSVRHAHEHTRAETVTGVECGVEDGLSAHFALTHSTGTLHLYDAWDALDPALSQDRTARNLAAHADRLRWHPGIIPDTLADDAPETVHWLHVDVNAAEPTRAVLEFFWPRIPEGGAVLFNAYGWLHCDPVRRTVNDFLCDKPGTLLPLPTGQAIYQR